MRTIVRNADQDDELFDEDQALRRFLVLMGKMLRLERKAERIRETEAQRASAKKSEADQAVRDEMLAVVLEMSLSKEAVDQLVKNLFSLIRQIQCWSCSTRG